MIIIVSVTWKTDLSMNNIVIIGLNHQTAPVELRECLARETDNAETVLNDIREDGNIHEGLFLSTCNRIEVLFTTSNIKKSEQKIINSLCTIGNLTQEQLLPSLYRYEDAVAVRHILRVAASLDSMALGEPQILGQVKDAYRLALGHKTSGVIINRLMHRAFHAAKRVRTETGISDSAISISYAAVNLAKKIFYELKGRRILLIGSGEMAELAAKHLIGQGAEEIVVANRTFDKAVQLARLYNGSAISFDEIPNELTRCDIIITSTAAPGYIIHHETVKSLLRKRRNRPLFIIDIAVPRDVDPKINELGNVYLYDIDDLKSIIEANINQRRQEAIKAERIIEEEVLKFDKWLKELAVVPTIISLKEKLEKIRQREIKRSMVNLGELSAEQVKSLEILTSSLVEKIIHDPILILKKRSDRPSRDAYLDMTRRLFKLDDEGDNEL